MLFKRLMVNGPYRNANAVIDYCTGSSGWHYAGSISDFNSPSGSATWSNLTNILGNDTGTYAASTTEADEPTGYTKLIEVTNFGFDIPDKEITGIEVEIGYSSDMEVNTELGFSNYAQLIIAGTKVGTNKGNHTLFLNDTAFVFDTFTLGNSTDLWGLTPVYTEINASNFGFAFQFENDGQPGRIADVRIYYVGIQVHYTC